MTPLALLIGLTSSFDNAEATESPPSLKCETGPVTRDFGGTQWLVYSCEDRRSLVFVSQAGNPASPFYFILYPKDGRYELYGEGKGDKSASDAAGDQISRVSQQEVAALIDETKAVPPTK